MKKGILFIISGPSGCGKGTICAEILEKSKDIEESISVTTRKPRSHEVNGENYFFINDNEFEGLVKDNMLLEWAEFCGNKYGTPKQYVMDKLGNNKDVLLEIEVQGALQVKGKFDKSVLIFLMPPSLELLRVRIEGRNTETKEIIDMRMERAKEEVKMTDKYDYIVVNDDLNTAIEDVFAIMRSEHLKSCRM
jgi:guanylate kinase